MHTVTALLCFVVVIHWLIFPFPSGLLHWHCGNLTIAPVPAKQPWWIWMNTSCEFIMNDCITTTKQSTTKPCAYFLGYTVWRIFSTWGRKDMEALTSLHLRLLCEFTGDRCIPIIMDQQCTALKFPSLLTQANDLRYHFTHVASLDVLYGTYRIFRPLIHWPLEK